jgi:hypothetical protein
MSIDATNSSRPIPGAYYLKDHYVGYPCALVRLDRIDEAMLRDLLLRGRRHVASLPRRARRLVGRGARPDPMTRGHILGTREWHDEIHLSRSCRPLAGAP